MGFKCFVLEVRILQGLQARFSEVRIIKELARGLGRDAASRWVRRQAGSFRSGAGDGWRSEANIGDGTTKRDYCQGTVL
jgi:hypothetical protein